ncbi:MAG: motB [Rickettsiaceae bacterium]|jgi:chemotaxis protein MotB|nr:motB [Rickettsiaceae bacterium]
MANDKAPIIIKKIKKGGHGGHHGGAWKVAYADFVTAMMAFFLLLWLLASASEKTLQGLADYFTPTVGINGQMGVGIKGGANPNYKEGISASSKGSNALVYGAPHGGATPQAPQATSIIDMQDEENFSSILKDLKEEVQKDQSLKDLADNILIDMTPEGLRIQIVDDADKPMFKPGTNELQPYMKKILSLVGKIVRMLPNYISISGHTRKEPKDKMTAESDQLKWVLSAMRANAVREYLADGHLNPDQILRIVGKADFEPLDPADPENIRNIRTSIVLLKTSLLSTQKQMIPSKLLEDKKDVKAEEKNDIKVETKVEEKKDK